jgi:hypothetical protein
MNKIYLKNEVSHENIVKTMKFYAITTLILGTELHAFKNEHSDFHITVVYIFIQLTLLCVCVNRIFFVFPFMTSVLFSYTNTIAIEPRHSTTNYLSRFATSQALAAQCTIECLAACRGILSFNSIIYSIHFYVFPYFD